MGQASAVSESKVDVLTNKELDIDNNTYNTFNASCQQSVTGAGNDSEVSEVSGSRVTVNQRNLLTNRCLLQSTLDNKITTLDKAEAITEMENKLKASGGFPSASTKSDTKLRDLMKTKVSTNVVNETKLKCILDVVNSGNKSVVRKISDGASIYVNQDNEKYNECLLDTLVDNGQLNESDKKTVNRIKNDQEAEAFNPITSFGKAIGSIFGTGGGSGWILLIIIIVMILAFLYLYTKSKAAAPAAVAAAALK